MKKIIKKKPLTLEKKIILLSDICYKIITNNSSIEKHSFEFLNFRNAHPSSLNIYNSYFSNKYEYLLKIKFFLKNEIYKILSIFRNEKLYFGDKIPEECDVIFISHFLNKEQAYNNFDNYYGVLLPELAKENKIKLVVVLKNHTWINQEKLKKWRLSSFCRILLSRTIGYKKEKEIINRLKLEGKNIKKKYKKKTIENKVALYAEKYSTSGSSKTALRMHEQIRCIVKKTKPKFLISTFEGHAWERLVFKAAKIENSNIICIGYHHSVLFPLQLGLTRKFGNGYDPDIIATGGKIGLKWFSSQKSWENTPIKILGSSRSYIKSVSQNKKACLVCPEGILSETLLLFELTINAAKILKKQKFILRIHPVLEHEKKINTFLNNINIPDNVTVSKNFLINDLDASKMILYRGSSLAITGVLAGLYPITFSPDYEKINIDPLSSINIENKVKSISELINKINKINKFKDFNLINDFLLAEKYCRSYFVPISTENFYKIIKV